MKVDIFRIFEISQLFSWIMKKGTLHLVFLSIKLFEKIRFLESAAQYSTKSAKAEFRKIGFLGFF
jgi:hypothetical protein